MTLGLNRSVHALKRVTAWSIMQCIMGLNNCFAGTSKVISNSVDNDFIHGHIHNWLHKELDKSTASQHLKSPQSRSGRSLHLTFVSKRSRLWSWMTNIPFVQCQSAFPFLRYGYAKIWSWKSMDKAMHVVKGQLHIVGSASNRFNSFLFHINQPCHIWDTAISKFNLENPKSRSWPRSKLMAIFQVLLFNRYVHFLFHGNQIILS